MNLTDLFDLCCQYIAMNVYNKNKIFFIMTY
jgi:hypothetical protein